MIRSVRVTRPLITLAVAFITGCASASTPTQRTETTYIPGVAGAISFSSENGSVTATLAAPLAAVWHLMPLAFDSAGVQLSLIDPKKHTIGNEGFKVRSKLRNERLSTYFECGTTQVGPNADSYELFVTVMADLQAVKQDSSRTRVTITVSGQGKPMAYSQDYSRCTSKTALERRILDVVSAALKR